MEAYYNHESGFSYTHKLNTDVRPNAYVQHVHGSCELFRFLDGDASFVIGSRRYPLSPGDLAIIPGAVVDFVDISSARYEREVIHFTSADVEESVMSAVFSAPAVLHIPKDSPVSENLDRFGELVRSFDAGALSRLLPNLLTELLYRLSALDFATVSGHDHDRIVGEAMRYLDCHTGAVRTEELCAALYISRSTLHRAFRETLGVSPMRYASVRRLLRAEAMLSLGDMPTTVSSELGYRDYSAFYRAYRAQFGHSPRVRHKESHKEITE